MSATLNSLFDRSALPNDSARVHVGRCSIVPASKCPVCRHLCVRCGRHAGSDALDECLGCTTKRLCPACMIEHNCGVRAAQKGMARK